MSRSLLTRKLGRGSKDDRLEAIEGELRRIRKLLEQNKGIKVADVQAKMATTGENAIPLRTAEVALVLGVKPASVLQFVFKKTLKQRWPGGRFHPDDVRDYLTHLEAAS